jgi:hypothetical protein
MPMFRALVLALVLPFAAGAAGAQHLLVPMDDAQQIT